MSWIQSICKMRESKQCNIKQFSVCTYTPMPSSWYRISTINLRFDAIAGFERGVLCMVGTASFFNSARLTKGVPGTVINGLSKSSDLKCSEQSREFAVGDHFARFVRTNATQSRRLFLSKSLSSGNLWRPILWEGSGRFEQPPATHLLGIFLTTYQEISIAKSSEVYVNTNCKWLPRSTSLGPVSINIISLGQKLMYGENALFWDLKGSEKVKKTVKMDGFFKNCHYLRVLLLINQIKKIGWYAL